MNEKSLNNLGEVLARMADQRRAADGLKADRSRIAKLLRAAKRRVKSERRLYGAYLAGLTDPRD
jgi:hypothetical protein